VGSSSYKGQFWRLLAPISLAHLPFVFWILNCTRVNLPDIRKKLGVEPFFPFATTYPTMNGKKQMSLLADSA
jgi:hypothetical protein